MADEKGAVILGPLRVDRTVSQLSKSIVRLFNCLGVRASVICDVMVKKRYAKVTVQDKEIEDFLMRALRLPGHVMNVFDLRELSHRPQTMTIKKEKKKRRMPMFNVIDLRWPFKKTDSKNEIFSPTRRSNQTSPTEQIPQQPDLNPTPQKVVTRLEPRPPGHWPSALGNDRPIAASVKWSAGGRTGSYDIIPSGIPPKQADHKAPKTTVVELKRAPLANNRKEELETSLIPGTVPISPEPGPDSYCRPDVTISGNIPPRLKVSTIPYRDVDPQRREDAKVKAGLWKWSENPYLPRPEAKTSQSPEVVKSPTPSIGIPIKVSRNDLAKAAVYSSYKYKAKGVSFPSDVIDRHIPHQSPDITSGSDEFSDDVTEFSDEKVTEFTRLTEESDSDAETGLNQTRRGKHTVKTTSVERLEELSESEADSGLEWMPRTRPRVQTRVKTPTLHRKSRKRDAHETSSPPTPRFLTSLDKGKGRSFKSGGTSARSVAQSTPHWLNPSRYDSTKLIPGKYDTTSQIPGATSQKEGQGQYNSPHHVTNQVRVSSSGTEYMSAPSVSIGYRDDRNGTEREIYNPRAAAISLDATSTTTDMSETTGDTSNTITVKDRTTTSQTETLSTDTTHATAHTSSTSETSASESSTSSSSYTASGGGNSTSNKTKHATTKSGRKRNSKSNKTKNFISEVGNKTNSKSDTTKVAFIESGNRANSNSSRSKVTSETGGKLDYESSKSEIASFGTWGKEVSFGCVKKMKSNSDKIEIISLETGSEKSNGSKVAPSENENGVGFNKMGGNNTGKNSASGNVTENNPRGNMDPDESETQRNNK